MTNPSDPVQLQSAFMASSLSKSFHRSGQQLFESIYQSKPPVFASEVLAPATSLPLAADQATLDAWIIANPNILQKYTDWVLTPDAISNNQMYYIDDGGWQKPWILEYMVPDGTNQPSNGYVMQLKEGVGGASPGTQISPTLGRWWVSPFEGAVHFEVGFTPVDMGWGAITVTCYAYIGPVASTSLGAIGSTPDVKIDAGPIISTPYEAFCEIDCGSIV